MVVLAIASWVLLGLSAFGTMAIAIELICLRSLRRRQLPTPERWPSFSILKPLCGLDDELLLNLESHLAIDYPGEYEILLGVRSEQDKAFGLAREFAQKHGPKVRLVMQQGEPGHNPKVNQLITLTREARHELLAITDSNVRVHPALLREHAAVLQNPKIGLASHAFAGVGEQRIGAVLDNLTLASFCAPNVAAAEIVLKVDQIIGKSIAMRREVLVEAGGWHEVKDVLAEDQRLGIALRKMGLRTALCPTPVHNVQQTQPFSAYWGRHTRWAMIRFRVLIPMVFLEPILNPLVMGLLAAALTPWDGFKWAFAGLTALASTVLTQVAAVLGRGHGFKLRHLLLVPLRDLLFFACWLRGSTMRWVTWRGTRLHVLAKTRLAEPDVLARAKNIQKLSR